MKIKFLSTFFLILFSFRLLADAIPIVKEYKRPTIQKFAETPQYKYPSNPHIPPEVWNLVKPYLLPSNHPIKYQLDKVFGQQRVCQSLQTLKNAGFSRCYIRGYSQMVVTKHPMLRGYWLKFFIDEQAITDYPRIIHRIEGAHAIRDFIRTHGYEDYFSVPNKWIYPLPAEPSPLPGSHRKNFILIAEDMDLYDKSENTKKWASKMTPVRALALYTILMELGLNDSIYMFNVPFAHDGRQSFIDTEHHHRWPVRFDLMTKFFHPTLQKYWKKIIETHGHPD